MEDYNILLENWLKRTQYSQTGHYIASEKLLRMHYFIGIPLITLSTFVGTGLFYSLLENSSSSLKILLTIASLLTTILASLQTFLRLSEKSEKHRSKAVVYGALKREIEQKKVDCPEKEIHNFIEDIRKRWDLVAQDSPITPHKIRKDIKKIIRDDI